MNMTIEDDSGGAYEYDELEKINKIQGGKTPDEKSQNAEEDYDHFYDRESVAIDEELGSAKDLDNKKTRKQELEDEIVEIRKALVLIDSEIESIPEKGDNKTRKQEYEQRVSHLKKRLNETNVELEALYKKEKDRPRRNTKKDLEDKIFELENKLLNLSTDLDDPSKINPVETKPAETKPKGELPKSFEIPVAEAPKPAETVKPKGTLPRGFGDKPEEKPVEHFKLHEALGPSAHTATDKWVLEDSLGYKVYAHSIYKFLTHKKTIPPLTINIQAPWGGGKTSIMRMIQDQLDPVGIIATTEKNKRKNKTKETKLKQILSVLRGENTEFNLNTDSMKRFTVWFNPWKYQNTEQVWAGLAHAIITQFSDRLSEEEKEKFLLELNVKRTGKENPLKKIKNQIFNSWKEQIRKYLWTYLSGIAGSSIITFLGTIEAYANWLPVGQVGIVLSTLSGGAISGFQYRNTENKVNDQPATSVLGKYVEIPDYSSKLGLIHHVQEDLQRVFEIIQDKMRKDSNTEVPIVIFIDDLDRCSPGKVAEVIDAINMFISAEFSNCIFVMGMDTQLVASALEKHYQNIIDKLPEYSKQISMGWKFMDKFVQLPVIIPPPDIESTKNYVNSLLLPEDGKTEEQEKAIQIASQVQENELDNITTSKDIDETVHRLTDQNEPNEEFSNEVKKQVNGALQNCLLSFHIA